MSIMVQKSLSDRYQKCDTSQLLILGACRKMRESLYNWVVIRVVTSLKRTILILNQFYLLIKVLDWYIRNKNLFTYLAPTSIKIYKILIIHNHGIKNRWYQSSTYSNHLPRVITSCASPSKSIGVVRRCEDNLTSSPNLCSRWIFVLECNIDMTDI